MRSRHALAFATVSTLALCSSLGFADTLENTPVKQSNAAQVLLVADGDVGRMDGEEKRRYPGREQDFVIHSRGHLVTLSMVATQERNLGPVQCTCDSYQLQENGPPKKVGSRRLTEYGNGDRTCNHPRGVADGEGNIVFAFGSDTNNNRPNLYAGIINEKCEQLAAPIMINARQANGASRDANDGATTCTYHGNGNFVCGYYSDGGGKEGPFPAAGGDYQVAVGLKMSGGVLPTLAVTYHLPVHEGGGQMRYEAARVDDNTAIVCGAQGGDRPPERIQCSLIDAINGRVITTNTFYDRANLTPEGKRVYYNQPNIVRVGDNQFALLVAESNGMGKNSNIKGQNITHLRIIERVGDSLVAGPEIVGVGAHQTHASLCSGAYGEQGAPALGVFTASPRGIGRSIIDMVQYDTAAKTFKYDERADRWPATWYGDSGWLSNMYGENPGNQGRNFLSCIGDVPNPGYGKANGYMSDVKSFFVATVSGRIPGKQKNSQFLALVPGQMDKKPIPSNPVTAGEESADDGSGAATNNGPKSDSGCGCETVGARSSSSGTLAFLGAGLAFGLVLARRRRAS